MKIILISVTLILTFSQILLCQWTQYSNGLGNINVTSLTSSGNIIFAGTTQKGVCKSTNFGETWTQTPLNNREVLSIASNNNYVYAGTGNYSLYYSTNLGVSWTQYEFSISQRTVKSLAVNDNIVLAGLRDHGVYRSTNYGISWSITSLNSLNIYSLSIKPSYIFAGTENLGIFRSTNNGLNWNQTTLNNLRVNSIAADSNNIFAGTAGFGIFKSTNNGLNWQQTVMNSEWIDALLLYNNNILAGDNNNFYISLNNGLTWNTKNDGLPIVAGIQTISINNGFVFIGTFSNGVYRRPLNEIIGIQLVSSAVPEDFRLEQNFPNPFNPTTNINFRIPLAGLTSIRIFNMLGRLIQTLFEEQLSPGSYKTEWNASQISSGIYIYRLESSSFSQSRKMILLK